MNLTPEQLKRQTCEAFTAWTLAPDDKKPKLEKSYNGTTWKCISSPIWRSVTHYRLAPSPVAAGHNPDKLTEEQVGVIEGWRLLDEDEISQDRNWMDEIELRSEGRWEDGKWCGNRKSATYRTRLTRDELAALDKPCEHKTLTISKCPTQGFCDKCGVELFYHTEAPYWRAEKPAWTLGRSVNRHTLAEGQEWHRDDFTEADLPAPYRPLTLNEAYDDATQVWAYGEGPWGKPTGYHNFATDEKYKLRTTRQLPAVAPAVADKTRPWNCAEDVPMPICWLRGRDSKSTAALITCVTAEGTYSGDKDDDDYFLKWKELSDYIYSTDGKTWHPCTISIP